MKSNALESPIQAQIRLELSKRGCIVIRQQCGRFLTLDGKRIVSIGIQGMSDLQAIFPDGTSAWIETKRSSGGRQREEQENFIKQMQSMNCKAGFAKSVDEAIRICGLEEPHEPPNNHCRPTTNI